MTIDALARRLRALLQDGSVPASSLSKRARTKLAALFDARILVEEPSGAGRRVVVRSRTGLENWISSVYPHGLGGHDDDFGASLSARATGVANLRDSKRGGGVGQALVHLRGFGRACLCRDDDILPVAQLTRDFGAASLLVDDDCRWQLNARVCTVENLEAFLHIEELIDDLDIAIFTHGRFSQQVIAWLADCSTPDATFIHAGDYDPVGLAEYLRLKRELGERAQLFIPADLDGRLSRYGNAELLRKSRRPLGELRKSDDPQVRQVVGLLDKHGRALEQEALLIPEPD